MTGLRVVELDKIFWRPGLTATPHDQWVGTQQDLIREDGWILDGGLGPYDDVEVRLRGADTIVCLDFSTSRCAWQALRRLRERAHFWLWLLRYRQVSRPLLMNAIRFHAPHARLHVLRDLQAVERFVADVASGQVDSD